MHSRRHDDGDGCAFAVLGPRWTFGRERHDSPRPCTSGFFETRVQPILKARCFKCHGGEAKVRGNFHVDSRSAVLRGGDLGPAITLERPEESLLLQAIHYDGLEMPPSGKLPGAEIGVLTRWVKEGLDRPAADRPAAVPAATATSVVAGKPSSRWAYGEVVRPALPAVRNPNWVRNPIDALLLDRLESEGREPAPPAERVALIRRLTYELPATRSTRARPRR
jgi:Planctomycete cytochrome C